MSVKEPWECGCNPDDSESVSFEFSTVDKVDLNDTDLQTVVDSLYQAQLLALTLGQLSQIDGEDLTAAALELAEHFGDVPIEYPIKESGLTDDEKRAEVFIATRSMALLLSDAILTIKDDTIVSTVNALEDKLNPLWEKMIVLLAKEFTFALASDHTALGDRIRVAMEHPQYNPPPEE